MIHCISRTSSDRRLVIKHSSKIAAGSQIIPESGYSNAIVKKPWGYEYLLFENEFVSIWILQIIRKRRTSMHCHPQKQTSLVLLSGNAICHFLGGRIQLGAQDSVIIQEGAFHSTEAFSPLSLQPHSEDGIWVMEIESPPLKTDLVRIEDEYGRTGSSYEGIEHIVFKSKESLKFQAPQTNQVIRKTFFDCLFTIRKGNFLRGRNYPRPDTLVSIIGQNSRLKTPLAHLRIGRLARFKDFKKNIRNKDLSNYTFLTIEKSEKMVKLSDFIFSFFAQLGVKEIYAVCGGTAMHLVDSLGTNAHLKYIALHHEQAAAMAAEAHARISGGPAAVLVASGAGATNTITGLYGAWIDSIPVIFISGQVTTDTLAKNTALRQFGIEEANIVKLVKPITKYAVTVVEASTIKYHLEKAVFLATTGRPGPVWLDIPLDIQSQLVIPEHLKSFNPRKLKRAASPPLPKTKIIKCLKLLRKARRPVIISGYGIRLAGAQKEFRRLVERLRIPLVSSWTSSDLIPTCHELYAGRSGIMGNRAANFAVQNSDLLLIIGSRMSIPQIGYNYRAFAREAKRVMVDIDRAELTKTSLKLDLAINADAKEFITEILNQLEEGKINLEVGPWIKRCRQWNFKYPVVLPEYKTIKKGVNAFYFIDNLCDKLGSDAVVVTDIGTSLISTMQAFKTKAGQRLFASSGQAAMGFGLPGAIGACFANGKKKTICIAGDGGLQTNIQELQTVVHHNLPIIIFVLNNGGYLTIKLMQQNHFGRYVGSDKNSGLSCPDIIKIAQAYGIEAQKITGQHKLGKKIEVILAHPGPFLCEIMMPENQPLIPRVSSLKKPDGTIVSKPLEDMYPFLSREEFLENMMVKPVEILKE